MLETGAQGTTLAEVAFVQQHSDVGILGFELDEDVSGAVGREVVDQDEFLVDIDHTGKCIEVVKQEMGIDLVFQIDFEKLFADIFELGKKIFLVTIEVCKFSTGSKASGIECVLDVVFLTNKICVVDG